MARIVVAKRHKKEREKMLRLMKPGELVKADTLAARVGISVRSVYRRIQRLRAEGHRIPGQAGMGYMRRPQ